MEKDIFSQEFLNASKVDEKKEVKPEPTTQPKAQVVEQKKDLPAQTKKKTLVEAFLTKVVEYAQTSDEQLDQKTKTFAVDIITNTNKQVVANGYDWKDIDVSGCGFVSQIKRWAKLGITSEDKLYIDIRNNGKTGLKDIAIKPQYQTLEKLIVKYFRKGYTVVRFKEDVVCVGDELEIEEDFETGVDKITKHVRNKDIDRNKLDNITGAYKIIYIRDDKNNLYSYPVIIDKNRIDRAYKASPSKEKTVWNLDSRKMVLKTVTWEMWNDKNIRAFMEFPDDVIRDVSVIEDTNDMDWDKETKNKTIEQAQENAQINVATGEVLDITYDD